MAVALATHRLLSPDHTVFLGDTMDCAPFSHHARLSVAEERGEDWKATEVDPVNAMLDEVQQNTKGNTHFLCGNHEHRVERALAKLGGLGYSLRSTLNVRAQIAKGRKQFKFYDYGVEPGQMRVKITNNLYAFHGWSTAKSAAHVHLAASRSNSIVFGHTHRAEELVVRDYWSDRNIVAACPGTLCKLHPQYIPNGSPTNWSHGVRLIYVGDNGNWSGYNLPIQHGSCVLPDGRQVTV